MYVYTMICNLKNTERLVELCTIMCYCLTGKYSLICNYKFIIVSQFTIVYFKA